MGFRSASHLGRRVFGVGFQFCCAAPAGTAKGRANLDSDPNNPGHTEAVSFPASFPPLPPAPSPRRARGRLTIAAIQFSLATLRTVLMLLSVTLGVWDGATTTNLVPVCSAMTRARLAARSSAAVTWLRSGKTDGFGVGFRFITKSSQGSKREWGRCCRKCPSHRPTRNNGPN